MKLLKVILPSLICLSIPIAAYAAPICPTLTGASGAYVAGNTPAASNCNTIITVGSTGTLGFAFPNTNPYDGSDDNYIGVVNNSSATVSSLSLTGSGGIFGFEGDGIDAFGIPGNAADLAAFGSGAYGGSDAFFTSIGSSGNDGVVNFIGGIAAGGTGYFSLEGAPAGGGSLGGTVGVTPEPSSLVLLGTGALGLAGTLRRRFLNK